jgi:hypothetical protein
MPDTLATASPAVATPTDPSSRSTIGAWFPEPAVNGDQGWPMVDEGPDHCRDTRLVTLSDHMSGIGESDEPGMTSHLGRDRRMVDRRRPAVELATHNQHRHT